MNAFDVTSPVQPLIATWIWRTLLTKELPQADHITVRVFGEVNVHGLESYLNERFSTSIWLVYTYEADQPAIEFRSPQEKYRYEKCNIAKATDTIELYHPDQLPEATRKVWRDWFKVFEQTPYLMMLPNQETASLLLLWVSLAKEQFLSLIKDDWIDAFVSSAEFAMTAEFECQTEATQAAMVGTIFLGRLINQPERVLLDKMAEARNFFSSITTINKEVLRQIHQWVIYDYIQG